MARTGRCFAWALIAFSFLLGGAPDVYAKQKTVTTLSSSPNPSEVGQAVTFIARVTSEQSGQSNQHCPDGSVQFQVDGANVGAPVRVQPLSGCAHTGGVATVTAAIKIRFPEGGQFPVVAIYGADRDFEGSSSEPYTHQVGPFAPVNTTTTISSSANPSVVGAPVTFTAVVTPAEWGFGIPSGTVTFTAGSTTVFIGTLTPGGWIEFTTSSLPEGANAITATYSGDGIFGGSIGTAVQAVTAASKTATNIALAASPPSVTIGETVWLTATVTPVEYVAGAPTGTVTFRSGTLTITGALNADGWVTVTTSALPLGADTITATYSGDEHYGASSATVIELVSALSSIPTRIDLVASPPATVFGEGVWLTATVTPDAWDFGDPTGTVAIFHTDARGNKSTLFNGVLPPAGWVGFTTVALPLGTNSFTATYSGDEHYGASKSATATTEVNPGAGRIATSIAAVAAPSTTLAGEPVWLTATVTPSEWTFGNPTGTVTFTSGNVTVTGTLSVGPSADWVTVVTSALPQGTHTITATYSGDAHYAGSSTTVVVTVNSLGIGTTLSLVSSPNPSNFGEPVTITATVVPGLWGYGAPAGTVTVAGGGVSLTGTLTDGWVTVLTSALPQGTHAITATYGGNGTFQGSTATVSQTVGPAISP